MDRLLESLVRKFGSPFFEPSAQGGGAPVFVRNGNVCVEDAYLNCDAIDKLLLSVAAEDGLPLPMTIKLGYIKHAQLVSDCFI